MIEDTLIDIIKNDEVVKEILKSTISNPKIYPYYKNEHIQCILHKFVPLSSDGIKEQNRLELTFIHEDELIAKKLMNRVKELLITVGDNKLNNEILEISLNGGGNLVDYQTNTIQLKAFFNIKNRVR